ncbi:glycosyltransferase family 2 protein [Candidatus Microgenomates bacterium]|nr:MAG: glycosyltransferase family 2 protein [Candidatus Microgenomates bacterium]
MKKIALIVPTFNEAKNIDSFLKTLLEIGKDLNGYSLFILVIDDYSPDGTGEIVKKIAAKHKNVTLISKEKEGLGAAIIFGMGYALQKIKPDVLMQIDADWSHNPKLLPQFLNKLDNGADFVIGSRYIKGGSIPPNWKWNRKLYSFFGNLWVRFGLGMLTPHDWSSGYRAMRREVVEKVYKGLEKYTGYTFQVAFLYRVKQAKFKVGEVPLVFIDRVHGKSKFPATQYIKEVSLFVINNSKIIKYLVVGVSGFLLQTVISSILISLGFFAGVAVTLGSFLGIVNNFLGNNLWTFSEHKIQGRRQLLKKFIHFLGTSIGAVIIQGVVVGVGVTIFGESAWFWLMVFAIAFLVIPYNYIIYNKFIWKTHKSRAAA